MLPNNVLLLVQIYQGKRSNIAGNTPIFCIAHCNHSTRLLYDILYYTTQNYRNLMKSLMQISKECFKDTNWNKVKGREQIVMYYCCLAYFILEHFLLF